MNQMLQALTYHVVWGLTIRVSLRMPHCAFPQVAVCWKVSAITAFACLALAKLLTAHAPGFQSPSTPPLIFENCRLCNAELCVLRIDVNCAKPYTCLGYLA